MLKVYRSLCLVLGLFVLVSCAEEGPEGVPAATEPLSTPAFTTTLQAQHSSKCADVPRSSQDQGTDLIQWTCNSKPNQRFEFHPVEGEGQTFQLKSVSSGLCVAARPQDGGVFQAVCNAAGAQQFRLEAVSPKVFLLANVQADKCLDVTRASKQNRAGLLVYRCHGNANQQFELAGYATPPAPEPEKLRVVAVGDIACDPTADDAYNGGNGTESRCRMKHTAEVAESLNPDAVFVLGDLQYSTALYEEFLQSYDPTWGRFKRITYPAPGNHEYANRRAPGYYAYFGSQAGDPSKGYYSAELGDWQVIVLNTNNHCRYVGCEAGSAQERWLREELANSTKSCVLVTMHYPRYSSGRHGGYALTDDLWDTLVAGGADLLLSGHDHHYERFAPQDSSGALAAKGLRQFVVGTGGKSLYPVGTPQANSEYRVEGQYGVLELSLGAGDYDWAFVTESGARLDAGSSSCN